MIKFIKRLMHVLIYILGFLLLSLLCLGIGIYIAEASSNQVERVDAWEKVIQDKKVLAYIENAREDSKLTIYEYLRINYQKVTLDSNAQKTKR